MLPEGTGWEWDGEWTTDPEGWQYSLSFVRTPWQRIRGEDIQWHSSCDAATFVRRRRWVRRAVNTAKLGQAGRLSHSSAETPDQHTPTDMARTLSTTSSRAALSDLLEGRGGTLPKDVSVQYLQTAGGGTALEGHLYKEGRGWPRTWEERYFVLWPKRPVSGRQLGFEHQFQLLFYFKDIDSTQAAGVGMVAMAGAAGAGLRTPTNQAIASGLMFMQTLVQMEHYTAEEAKQREGYDCRKIKYDEIVGLKGLRLETQPRVLKIGVPLLTAGRVSSSSAGSTGEPSAASTVSEMIQWERALICDRACLAAGALSRQVEWKYEGASGLNPLRWSKKPLADVATDLQQPTTEDRPVKVRFPGKSESRTFEKPLEAAKWLLSLDLDALALAAGEPTTPDDQRELQCFECGVEFSWLRRRHHCRACKNAFCDGCSQHKADVRGFEAPQRVCAACYHEGQSPLPLEPQPEREIASNDEEFAERLPPDGGEVVSR